MIRPLRRAPLVLVLALAGGASAFADEVVLRTGTRYEGKIVSEDATHWVIDTTDLGPMRIPKADVLRVNVEKPAEAPAPKARKKPAPKEEPEEAPEEDAEAAAARAAEEARIAAEKAAEEARRKEEQAALDALERVERRRRASVRRRTDPGADRPAAAEAAPAAAASARPEAVRVERDAERTALSASTLAATERGVPLLVFEPPRPFAPAPSGIMLGRRTFARFEQSGAATAIFAVKNGEKEERLSLRLADVQRHIVARSEESRVRVLEGISEGDWVRLRLDDGSFVSGRFASLDDTALVLRVPSADGPPGAATVEVGRIVQADGLIGAHGIARALNDLERGEPVSLVSWPDGAETTGRFVDRMEHHVRIDRDGDGEADAVVPVDGPIADVRRIPPTWREAAREWKKGTVLRVRGREQYADARVERVLAAKLAAVTAYTVALHVEDGCAVVPFESLVGCEAGTPADLEAAANRIEAAAAGLPVLPGTPVEEAKALELPKGVSFVTDGRVVTQVFLSTPWDRPVCGVQLGDRAEDALPRSDLFFGVEVIPATEEERSRELVSESIEGLRLTAYVDRRGVVDVLQISRR